MIPERLERVRTATDATITIMSYWDPTDTPVAKINWKARAEQVYQYLNDHSNEQFFQSLAACFRKNQISNNNESRGKTE